MAIQPFPARTGFVKQAEDGAFILTADAYRFIRDMLNVLGGGAQVSVADIETLSQFADVSSASVEAETLHRVTSEHPDFRIAELSKRIDWMETVLAQQANPAALLSETVKWGTYTPTLTNVSGITASTAYECQYVLLGRMVVVSGQVDIDAAALGSNMQLGMSLPIASNFSATEQCGGVASASATDLGVCSVVADTVNNRAEFKGTPPSASDEAYNFIFMYKIV